ncbi:hypothetical protein FIM25_04165 [Desulfobotulus mexicanus]|uniref:Uncharacterized protein n=1 Tax=Desulfobotulus mexicanus TaxID=2586642 RepID=A0A5Q4VHI1_9BACT|nr:hypothetical protein FIM25_04165 [Desulfobotulus mexicanus]
MTTWSHILISHTAHHKNRQGKIPFSCLQTRKGTFKQFQIQEYGTFLKNISSMFLGQFSLKALTK